VAKIISGLSMGESFQKTQRMKVKKKATGKND
jgi:hypothetical protein